MTENRPIKKPEISINFEETLKLFKNILPQDLVKATIKAKKNIDQTEFKDYESKISSIIKRYMAKIRNPQFNEGEQILKRYPIKGQENAEKVITNLRACTIFWKNGQPIVTGSPIGLHISDTAVTTRCHKSSGTSSKFSRTSSSQSTSIAYGDLVFVFAGKKVFCFYNISDPHGVKNLIQTFKKQPISV